MALSALEIAEAVGAAKEVFWRRGFDEASMEEIVEATGLNRYALYTKIGGKRELFLAALEDYYLERKQVFLTAICDEDTPPIEAIRRVFDFAITEMAERETGCLMSNVAAELAPDDAEVGQRIEMYLSEIRAAYRDALERAQSRGELNGAISPEEGAALLITLKLGLGVRARHGASAEEMRGVITGALAAFAPPQSIKAKRVD